MKTMKQTSPSPTQRLAALLLRAIGCLCTSVHGANEPTLIHERLTPDIHLFRAPSALDLWTSSNAVVIVNADDVVVFDNNARPATTRMLISEIRKLTPKPVRTLVNSHWHLDHWSGNGEFANAWPGLRIIATRQSREYMQRMGPGYFADMVGRGVGRARTALEEAIRTGTEADGTPLTTEERAAQQREIELATAFTTETAKMPRVLPNLVFDGELRFWSGTREFRLIEATGDATGSAVLFLPAEGLLATGDVLVRPEEGEGAPPWTTNSNAIAPWLASLRQLDALDASIIVPGQGAALRDEAYLTLTVELWAAIIAQVHEALERGVFLQDEVIKAVDVDAIGLRYTPGATEVSPGFKRLVATLARKAYLESLDGAGREPVAK